MRILFAEDDPDLSRAVTTILQRNGYEVDAVDCGQDALDHALEEHYDAIVLDWMMPYPDGVTVLRRLREKGVRTPSMLLTARTSVEDRITGLDAGADDHLSKPFAMGELLARVRALLRRNEGWRSETVTVGNTTLDRSTMELSCGDRRARLSTKAFQTLQLFMDAPGRVFPAETIMDRVWGWDSEA